MPTKINKKQTRKARKNSQVKMRKNLSTKEILFYQRNSKHTAPLPDPDIEIKKYFIKYSRRFLFSPYSAVFVFLGFIILLQSAFPALSFNNSTKRWRTIYDWQEWEIHNLEITDEGSLRLAELDNIEVVEEQKNTQVEVEEEEETEQAEVIEDPSLQEQAPGIFLGEEFSEEEQAQEEENFEEEVTEQTKQEEVTEETQTEDLIIEDEVTEQEEPQEQQEEFFDPAQNEEGIEVLEEIVKQYVYIAAESIEEEVAEEENQQEEPTQEEQLNEESAEQSEESEEVLLEENQNEPEEEEEQADAEELQEDEWVLEEESQKEFQAESPSSLQEDQEIVVDNNQSVSLLPLFEREGFAKLHFVPVEEARQIWLDYRAKTKDTDDQHQIKITFSNDNQYYVDNLEDIDASVGVHIKISFFGLSQKTPILRSLTLIYKNELQYLQDQDQVEELTDDKIERRKLKAIALNQKLKDRIKQKNIRKNAIPNEIINARSRYSRRFLEQDNAINDAGEEVARMKAEIYRKPVNYLDDQDNWQLIDNEFEPLNTDDFEVVATTETISDETTDLESDTALDELNTLKIQEPAPNFSYATLQNQWQTYFPQYANQPHRIEYEDHIVEFLINNANSNSQAQANENQIIYTDVFDQIDFVYTVNNSSVKEDIIVKAETNISEISYQMKIANVNFVKSENGNINFYDNNTEELVWNIQKPFATDFIGQGLTGELDIIQQDLDTYQISLIFDYEILHNPRAVYPITIDPTVTIYVGAAANYKDGRVLYNGSTYADDNTTADDARTGIYSTLTHTYRNYYDFDTTAIPDDATISDVDLNVYVIAFAGTPTHNINKMSSKADTYIDVANIAGLYGDAGNTDSGGDRVTYVSGTTVYQTTGWKSRDLGTTADSDLEDNLASDWFSVGIAGVQTSGDHWSRLGTQEGSTDAYLSIIYNMPSPCTNITFSINTAIAEDITCTGTVTINSGATLTVSGARTITANDLVLSNGHMASSSSGEGTALTLAITDAITLSSGSTITSNLDITAATVTINSGTTISANGKGYAGGAAAQDGQGPGGGKTATANSNGGGGGYGGYGGNGDPYTGSLPYGGVTYDLSSSPQSLGSGGSGTTFGPFSVAGSAGGGLIEFDVAGTLTNNGTVSANGVNGVLLSVSESGSGSGGGINITADTLAGSTGTFTANGGTSVNDIGGGGGGGRIYASYTSNTYTGTYTANGGTGYQNGGDGTIGLYDPANDDLIIEDGWQWHTAADLTYRNVTINNASNIRTTTTDTLNLSGTLTVSTSTWTIINTSGNKYPTIAVDTLRINNSSIINQAKGEEATTTLNITNGIVMSSNSSITSNLNIFADSMTIEPGSTLSANGKGYNGGTAGAAGQGPGGPLGVGALCTSGGGGAGYGADGGLSVGNCAVNYKGYSNGSETTPVTLGSGGGGGGFGAGTGGTGGTGGGIILLNIIGFLTHDGTISSNGTNGAAGAGLLAASGGGGSGGTVYIRVGNTFNGIGGATITANGGNGGTGGSWEDGSGGGGGRISTWECTDSFSGTKSAAFGTGNNPGEAATPYNNTTYCPPGATFNTAEQRTNGTGLVKVDMEAIDIDDSDVMINVQYCALACTSCSSENWSPSTIINPVESADYPDGGPLPDVNNSNEYQIGTVTKVVTSSGSNTVVFDWDSVTDGETSADGAYCMKLTAEDSDGNVQVRPNEIDLTLDNADPTVSSLTISDPGSADYTNGGDWYDQGEHAQMAFTSTPADTNLASCNWTWENDGGSDDYSDSDVEIGTDGDISTADMSGASIDLTDDTDGGITLTVTCTDDYGNTGNSNITYGFDNTAPSGLANLAVTDTDNSYCTLGWTAATESRFDHYEVWWGQDQDDVNNREGTATEWDEDQDGDLSTVSTADTSVNLLEADNTYYFKIWAIDKLITNEATTAGTSCFSSTNQAPTGSFNSATSKTDGTGYVDISIEVDDADDDETKAKIEYCADACASCSGGPWLDPTLSGPTTADFQDEGGVPDVDNAETYQIGSTANYRITTIEGSNTVTFDWDSQTDVASGDGTYCLRLTVNDDNADQATPATQELTIDNVGPTVSSLTISTPASPDYSSGGDWYDQSEHAQMSFTSIPSDTNTVASCDWDWENDADAADQANDYDDNDVEIDDDSAGDGDITAAEMLTGGIDLSDDDDGEITLSVQCTDNYGNTGSAASINFTFDNTNPTQPGSASCDSGSTWSQDTGIVVTWSASTDTGGSGISGYYADYNTTPPVSSQSSGDTLTGAENNTATFYVRAEDNVGNLSTIGSDSIGIDLTNPDGMGSFAVDSVTYTTAVLTWVATTETNFNHYEIWYGENQADVQNREGTATEWDDDDDANLSTITTATTTITPLSSGTTYYFKIWAIDDSGRIETETDINETTTANSVPTGTFNSAAQRTDGTGYVDISIEVADIDAHNTKAKIEYCADACASCGGGPWLDPPTLVGPATADNAPAPDIANASEYQIGSVTPILTSSSNTVTFDWDTATDISSADGSYCLRLTANDGYEDQASPATQELTLDNVSPVVSSLQLTYSADTVNSGGYDYYKQSTQSQAAITSTPTESNISFCDWTWANDEATNNAAYDYSDSNVEIGTDGGISVQNMVDNSIDLSDDLDGTITVTVTCEDTYGNSGASNINFRFDSTGPTNISNLSATPASISSVDLTWYQATDNIFDHYEIWYGTDQSQVQSRGAGASEWDEDNDGNLSTDTTQSTTITGLSNGTLYYFTIWAVDALENDTTGGNSSATTVAVCGNGSVEPGEECDDGNQNSGDGCDPGCQDEDDSGCTTPNSCGSWSNCVAGQRTRTCIYSCVPTPETTSCDCNPGDDPQTCGTDVGECAVGTQSCLDTYFWGTCVGGVLPIPEIYDLLDNDCDGQTDEGFCTPTTTIPCGTNDIGICQMGIQTCDSDGLWGACIGAINPTNETCADNLDNDCDGQTDEGCGPCVPDDTRSCGTSEVGVCELGTQTCQQNGNWGICYGAINPAGSDTCDDNIDNDCDGIVDEGCQCEPGLERVCGYSDVGACEYGAQTCNENGFWPDECVGSIDPVSEICDDGIDNDCDGFADQGCGEGECTPTQSEVCGETNNGECSYGIRTCQQDSTWGVCVGEVAPVVEVCGDGLDNDCDGFTDEGCLICNPGDTKNCGTSEVGVCEFGTQTCNDTGAWGTCIGAIYPTEDICYDLLDNDCDGQVDEDCSFCTNGDVAQCGYTDVGACEYGSRSCTDGYWSPCTGAVFPTTEVCDYIDNNCDGNVDEDCCTPLWEYTEWGDCVNDERRRTAYDRNGCGTAEGLEDLTQSCEMCEPSWVCGWSGECIDDIEDTTCIDSNNCDVPDQAPVEHRACGEEEECTIDCPSCFTVDIEECTCAVVEQCCGNFVCEPGENYESCSYDCDALVVARECQDGLDNDGDDLVDYPNDPGCSSETDNSESSLTEIVLNIGENSENLVEFTQLISIRTLEAIQQTVIKPITNLVNNPDVEQITEVAIAPAIVAVSGATVVSAFNFMNVLAYLQYIFTQPFYLINRRRRKKWGAVYHAVTKKPVDLAIVRLYDRSNNRLIRSRVTDKLGRYNFLVAPGYYYLQVTKPQYNFPSQILKKKKQDFKYLDIYHGDVIDVVDKDVLITANIPLDPAVPVEEPKEILRKRRIKKVQKALAFGSVPLAFVPVLIIPSVTTVSLFGVQIGLFFLFKKLALPAKPKGWGVVRDKSSKTPVKNAIMRIFDKQYNKLLETQVTDAKGRYSFLTSGDEYYIVAEKQGYQKFQKDIPPLPAEREGEKAQVVSLDIALEKAGGGNDIGRPTSGRPTMEPPNDITRPPNTLSSGPVIKSDTTQDMSSSSTQSSKTTPPENNKPHKPILKE
ncbi:fibronectin type III domain-containing protein [Patescibacteria group bacterium]|nr:fibronectin type III domain-containing protein [Patescibacteria group bacterium]